MAVPGRTLAVVGIALAGIVYQFVIKDLIFGAFGYGRSVQSISEFPNFNCERIEVPGLEACEDMWLHEETGYLYVACSKTESRLAWMPS